MSEAVSVERETTDPDSRGSHERNTALYAHSHRVTSASHVILERVDRRRKRIGYRVRLFSGGWRGNGKEGSSADERVPLQLGVLGVGGDTNQPGKAVPRSAGVHVAQSRASSRIDPCDVVLASSAGESRACSLPLVSSLWQQDSSGLRRARPPTSLGSRSWSGLFLSSHRQVNSPMAPSRGEVGRFYPAE